MIGGESLKVRGVMRQDQATAEAYRCCHDESVDGHLAPRADLGKEVTGSSGDPDLGGDHPRVSPIECCVDGIVETRFSIQLDQHCGRDAHRLIPDFGGSHGGSDSFVSGERVSRASER